MAFKAVLGSIWARPAGPGSREPSPLQVLAPQGFDPRAGPGTYQDGFVVVVADGIYTRVATADSIANGVGVLPRLFSLQEQEQSS